jgi:hypothetical protein
LPGATGKPVDAELRSPWRVIRVCLVVESNI